MDEDEHGHTLLLGHVMLSSVSHTSSSRMSSFLLVIWKVRKRVAMACTHSMLPTKMSSSLAGAGAMECVRHFAEALLLDRRSQVRVEGGHGFYSTFLEKWVSLAIVMPPPFQRQEWKG